MSSKLVAIHNRFGALGKIEIAGDPEWSLTMRANLKVLVQQRYGKDMRQPSSAKFNLEPFEVIRDLLMDPDPNESIGGAPQAVKVYQYMNSADVGIFWPDVESGRLFMSGRPLLEYECATIKSLWDPISLNSTWSDGSTADARGQVQIGIEKQRTRLSDQDSGVPDSA